MTEVDALLDDLHEANEAVTDTQARVTALGEDQLHRLEQAYSRFDELLRSYRETASGSGRETFQAYIEFEGRLDEFTSSLPPDLIERDTVEAAADVLDKRRLTETDFERAQSELAPVETTLEALTNRSEALERYRSARRRVADRLRETESRIDHLERILAFESVDFQAPVSDLRSPMMEYNTSVTAAFDEFLSKTPARTVMDFIQSTTAFPLVDFPDPPPDLASYLASTPAGDEPIPTLRTYTEYTRSKLGHYVNDPSSFHAIVSSNKTYLDRLDADPVTLDWPPAPADELRWQTTELIKVIDRFAPPDTIARLHDIQDLARNDERYVSLREAARADETLTDTERAKLESGALETELETAIRDRERLADALDTYPDR